MNNISVNSSNIDIEHICCAITDKKGEYCVSSKKRWMKQQREDGLIFNKLDASGIVFIEYMPFVTNEIFSGNKFMKFLDEKGH